MKATSFLFTLIILTSTVFAQESETPQPKTTHEIGVNFTFFVKTFLSLNNSNSNNISTPYALSYKLLRNNNGMRFGVGGIFNETIQKDERDTTELSTKNTSFDFRLGYERQVPVTKRWLTYFGWDILYGLGNTSSETESVNTKETTQTIGTGPVIGIQFNINKKIKLFTESSVYFTSSDISRKETFQNFPQQNLEENGSSTDFSFGLPTNIFLTITL